MKHVKKHTSNSIISSGSHKKCKICGRPVTRYGKILLCDVCYNREWRRKNREKFRAYERNRYWSQREHRLALAKKYSRRKYEARLLKLRKRLQEEIYVVKSKKPTAEGLVGFAAGMLCADGCIRLGIGGRGGNRIAPRLQISNTDYELLSRCNGILGKWARSEDHRSSSSSKIIYTIYTDAYEGILHTLCILFPYLYGRKRKIAELVMEFILSVMSRMKLERRNYTPRELQIFNEVTELNRVGGKGHMTKNIFSSKGIIKVSYNE